MATNLTHIINIKDTVLFQSVQSYNASLKILRTLFFLDQCHDFLQKEPRNRWKGEGKRRIAHEILYDQFKTDIEFIDNTWPTKEAQSLAPNQKETDVDDLLEEIDSPSSPISASRKAKQGAGITKRPQRSPARGGSPSSSKKKKLCNPGGSIGDFDCVKERDKINSIAKQLQKAAGIVDFDLADGTTRFNVFNYAAILPRLLDPNTKSNKFLIGADADKQFSHFCALSVSIYNNVDISKGGDIQIFESPATAYDGAGASAFIEYMKRIVSIKKDTAAAVTVPGTSMKRQKLVYVPPDKKSGATIMVEVPEEHPTAAGKKFKQVVPDDLTTMDMSTRAMVQGGKNMTVNVFGQDMTVMVPPGITRGQDFTFQVSTFPVELPTEPKFNSYNLILKAKDIKVIDITYQDIPAESYTNEREVKKYVKDKPPYNLYIDRFFERRNRLSTQSGTGLFSKSSEDDKKRNFWPDNDKDFKKYSVAYLTHYYEPDDDIFLYKTMGDFGQILSFYATYNDLLADGTSFREKGFNPIFTSFDRLSATISSMFNKSTILESTSGKAQNNLRIFKPIDYNTSGLRFIMNNLPSSIAGPAIKFQQSPLWQTGVISPLTSRLGLSFGKKSNKISVVSTNDLKLKLKSVGINVTKVTRSGKRLPLTRKELEEKARMFKNLQLRAKKMNVRLMYKSKRRGYVYKSYIRLTNEIQRKGKMKFG
jgi:hypothetical protein